MELRLIERKISSVGYGNHHGKTINMIYECPCGKGTVTYEIDDIPGFKNWDIYCECKDCNEKYAFKRGGIAEMK
jgi:hypothetical protein